MFKIKIEFQYVCRFALCIIYSIYSTEKWRIKLPEERKVYVFNFFKHWTLNTIGNQFRCMISALFLPLFQSSFFSWVWSLFDSNNATNGINAKVFNSNSCSTQSKKGDYSFYAHSYHFQSIFIIILNAWAANVHVATILICSFFNFDTLFINKLISSSAK